MTDWNPDLYYRFRAERGRPLQDLLDLLPPRVEGALLDLGCGDGAGTREAARRLGVGSVRGVDGSQAMIAAAQAGDDGDVDCTWEHGDLVDALDDEATYAAVVSNSALHWVGDHDTTFPRVLERVAPGGWVAVQMPFNHVARTHLLIRAAAEMCPVSAQFAGFSWHWPQSRPALYADAMKSAGFDLQVVQLRTYRHPMESLDAIVDFVRGAALRPWLDRLDAHDHEEFLATYRRLLGYAYPAIDDRGTRLLDYARLFIVGRRPPLVGAADEE